MAIGQDKTRTNLTVSKEMKKELEQLAKEQNRSFNNLVITILTQYLISSKQ